MSLLNAIFDLCWCIIEDFNELLRPEGKVGEAVINKDKTHHLNQFISQIDAVSLMPNGRPFTWKNNLKGHLIYEQLDRAIARKDCMVKYHTLKSHRVYSHFHTIASCLWMPLHPNTELKIEASVFN